MDKSILQISGLKTNPSPIAVEPGALDVAENINIDQDNTAISRRGFGKFGTQITLGGNKFNKIITFINTILVHFGSTLTRDSDGLGTWVDYTGTFDLADTNIGFRSIEYLGSLFFTSLTGVKVLDSLTGTPKDSGQPKALGAIVALTGTSGFFTNDTQVAYRIVWGRKDANNILKLGVPSERIEIRNEQGASRNVLLKILIPDEITVTDFVRIYRTGFSVNAATLANDEMGLVFEANPTASEITAGILDNITDTAPDTVRGVALYTSPSQEGIIGSNNRPPFALDIAIFRESAIYANTRTRHSLLITLKEVSPTGSSTGLIAGDVITIGGLTYTAIDKQILSENDFTTTTKWTVTGDFTFLSNAARLLHTTGAGELKQINSNLAITPENSKIYKFRYTITETTAYDGKIFIKGGTGFIPLIDINLPVTDGTHEVTFVSDSAASTGDFRIDPDGTTGLGNIFLDNFFLVLVEIDATSGDFVIDLSGTPAENIRNTAQSLIRSINIQSTTLQSFYRSGFNDFPGKILIEKINVDDISFAATASSTRAGEAFVPVLPISGTTVSSANEKRTNRLVVSKKGQPDAIPLLSFLDIGSDSSGILRIISLRESLFVFKDDGEIYRIVGNDIFSFNVQLFDKTVNLFGPKTAEVLNNRIFLFSNQGVVAVSDNGIQIKSWWIENQVLPFLSTTLNPTFETDAFGIAYNSARKYILSDQKKCFVYNDLTNSWTTWNIAKQTGYLSPTDDKLYWGDSDGFIRRERKDLTKFDNADDTISVTITVISGLIITLSDATGVNVDDALKQGTVTANIVAVNGNDITLDAILSWTLASADVFSSFECKLKWLPIYGETPHIMKRFREMSCNFRDINDTIKITFDNNFNTKQPVSVNIPVSVFDEGWGEPIWDDGAWGGDLVSGPQEVRTYFPLEMQRALWANIEVSVKRAFSLFTLNGVAVHYEYMSERFTKSVKT